MLYRRDRQIISDVFFIGGVFAYPTEAVWGLGCDLNNEAAVQRLLAIKSRPQAKGMILVTGDLEAVAPLLASVSSEQKARALGYWPGHRTLLIPDQKFLFPEYIRGVHDTIAVRVSNHPFIRWFSHSVSPFLVSTSANIAGAAPCRFEWQVRRRLGKSLDYIVPGCTSAAGRPSEIIDLVTNQSVRV